MKEMPVKDGGGGEPADHGAGLTPVKGEREGRRLGYEEPQNAVTSAKVSARQNGSLCKNRALEKNGPAPVPSPSMPVDGRELPG